MNNYSKSIDRNCKKYVRVDSFKKCESSVLAILVKGSEMLTDFKYPEGDFYNDTDADAKIGSLANNKNINSMFQEKLKSYKLSNFEENILIIKLFKKISDRELSRYLNCCNHHVRNHALDIGIRYPQFKKYLKPMEQSNG